MRRPLSVVVPTRDRPAQLERCLASLRAQLEAEDELIVGDSASCRSNEVAEVAAQHGARYLRCDVPGASRARNAGWRAAAHDVVAFIDDDVLVAPGWRAAVDDALSAAPSAAFHTGRVDTPPDQRGTTRPVAVALHDDAFAIGPEVVGAIGGSGNLIVTVAALREVGGFDEDLGAGARFRAAEDNDLFDRLLAAGHRGRHDPAVEAWHEQWRTKVATIPLARAYGIGTGARLAKLVRTDRRRARLAAADFVWTWGVVDLVRCIRFRSRLGVLTAIARLAGTAAGFARAIVRPVRDGHLGARSSRSVPLFVDARRLAPPRAGVGNHLAALVAAWQDDPDLRGRVVLLTRRGDEPAPGLALSTRPLRGGPLWHLRAATAVRVARGRFVSPESLIVPILLGRRATVTVHDLAALRLQDAHPVRTRVVFRSLLGLAVRRAGRVIVPSEATAAELRRSFPRADRTTVVVRNARRRLSSTAQPPSGLGRYVLFVGTLEPRKNVEVLVRAFQQVAPAGWRLVLVGAWGWLQEPERQRLEALIDADPRVEHHGYVDDSDLANLYAGAEVFAYPSSYEGFGLPVLEAMAFGTPVIVTDTPALVEVAGGAARLVDPADLQGSLETALAELLGDDDLRRALGRRSLERARWLAEEERSAAARVAAVCLGAR